MKRIFTLLFVFTIFHFSHAQIKKGSLLLDGQFTIGSYVGEDNTPFFAGLSPSAGLFISDRFVIGAGIGVGYASLSGFDGGNLIVSPFARYYLSNKEDSPWKWFVAAGGRFSFLFGNADNDPMYGLNAGTGVNYFINNNVALEGSLLFVSQDLDSRLRDNSRLVLGFSIRFFLNPEEEEDGELSIFKSNKLFVGGSMAALTTDLSSRGNAQSINLNPRIGWFLSEKWAVGSSVLINYSSTEFFSGFGAGVSPFLRFYPQNSNGPFQWFATVEAGLQYYSSKFDDFIPISPEIDTDGWLKNFSTGVGANWFLNEHVALEGILSYQYNETSALPVIERTIGFDVGFQFFLSR
jgi:hypothetical protein